MGRALENMACPACTSRKNVTPDQALYIEAFPMGRTRQVASKGGSKRAKPIE